MGVFDGLPDVFIGALGQAVTVTPTGGAAREITAIFVSQAEVDPLDDIGAVTQRTRITARAADVSDISVGDTVVVGANSYVTAAPVPDAHGMTTFPLRFTGVVAPVGADSAVWASGDNWVWASGDNVTWS